MNRVHLRAVGRRLSDRRHALNLEQHEVAMRAGCSEAYISRLETGAVPNPKILDLEAVAGAINLPLPALLYGDVPTEGRVLLWFEATAVAHGSDAQVGDRWKLIVDTLTALGCVDISLRESERIPAPGVARRGEVRGR